MYISQGGCLLLITMMAIATTIGAKCGIVCHPHSLRLLCILFNASLQVVDLTSTVLCRHCQILMSFSWLGDL